MLARRYSWNDTSWMAEKVSNRKEKKASERYGCFSGIRKLFCPCSTDRFQITNDWGRNNVAKLFFVRSASDWWHKKRHFAAILFSQLFILYTLMTLFLPAIFFGKLSLSLSTTKKKEANTDRSVYKKSFIDWDTKTHSASLFQRPIELTESHAHLKIICQYSSSAKVSSSFCSLFLCQQVYIHRFLIFWISFRWRRM